MPIENKLLVLTLHPRGGYPVLTAERLAILLRNVRLPGLKVEHSGRPNSSGNSIKRISSEETPSQPGLQRNEDGLP